MMVITRTPLRISFFGGGTDYPVWYRKHGGAVLSTTIDKYNYITVRRIPPFFDFKTHVVWSQIEKVNHVDEILHPSVRETIKFAKMGKDGLGIHYYGDVPARSGIGSSSSFTVGLLHALYALRNKEVSKDRLAREAIHIEQNRIKENVGSQDQVAAAVGGLNVITFGGKRDFSISSLTINAARKKELESHLMLFFTGQTRTASDVAAVQIKNTPAKEKELHAMRAMVDEAREILLSQKKHITAFGDLLHSNWQIKRSLSSKISNEVIDTLYASARCAGAIGGKVLGAGNGGFFLVFARPKDRPRIQKALKNFLLVPFSFESSGSVVMYRHKNTRTQ